MDSEKNPAALHKVQRRREVFSTIQITIVQQPMKSRMGGTS